MEGLRMTFGAVLQDSPGTEEYSPDSKQRFGALSELRSRGENFPAAHLAKNAAQNPFLYRTAAVVRKRTHRGCPAHAIQCTDMPREPKLFFARLDFVNDEVLISSVPF